MSCFNPRPRYPNPPFKGIAYANSQGDGYTVELRWFKAVSSDSDFVVAYNVYYSTIREDVFSEGVKFVVTDPDQINGKLVGFTPGDVVYFAVRGTLHDPVLTSLNTLPETSDGCKLYPEGILLSSITDTDLVIPVSDIETFPAFGLIQIGVELIAYQNVDIPNSSLVLDGYARRGLFGTEPRLHDPDGYDGIKTHDNPLVRIFHGFEDDNTSVILEEIKFSEPHFARTNLDGYRNQTDKVTTDLSSSEADQIDFPGFDFSGFRRTDPVALLRGDCVGSYYGGEHNCADGYGGVGQQIRGLGIEDFNNQREEVLLSLTGEPMVLVRRLWEGITCNCVSSSRETPEHRCPTCFGTGFVTGYQQFYNQRRSDGRILVHFDPAPEDLVPMEPGLESDYKPNAWTLSTPIIKDRDFLIRFNKDGTEEFRYEVLNVTRNKILLNNVGGQRFAMHRVRKTDPIYMWRAFRNTATMPQTITTDIGMVPGPGGIPPHIHEVVINENTLSLVQINQTTDVAQGHNHPIINGVVTEVLGHSHNLVLP